jgi:hypothetical protein
MGMFCGINNEGVATELGCLGHEQAYMYDVPTGGDGSDDGPRRSCRREINGPPTAQLGSSVEGNDPPCMFPSR